MSDKSRIVSAENCLFVGQDISEKLRDWCKDREIQGTIFECYDGGGFTRYAIEFTDPATKDRVAAEFEHQTDRDHFLGEAINQLSCLW